MPPSAAPAGRAPRAAARDRRRRARARPRRASSRARRARRARRGAVARRAAALGTPAPSFSFSSSTTRCAVFLPMPGIASKRAVSSSAIARRSSAGVEPGDDRERDLRPDAGDGEQSWTKSSRSLGVREAVQLQRVLADVEVRLDRHLVAPSPREARAASPGRGSRRRRRRARARRRDGRRACPRSRAITRPPSRSGGASAWQIATASASAAWSASAARRARGSPSPSAAPAPSRRGRSRRPPA